MKIYLIFLVALFTSSDILAQNNERKGFILGLGVGPSTNSYDFGFGISDNSLAFASNFKIGYAPTDQVALYWSSQVAWFKIDGLDALTTNSVAGLGGSYYLNEDAPSLYLNAVLGFANWATPFEPDASNSLGFGLGIGGGYEFARHWSPEINFTYGKPSDDFIEIKTWSVRLTINYLMY